MLVFKLASQRVESALAKGKLRTLIITDHMNHYEPLLQVLPQLNHFVYPQKSNAGQKVTGDTVSN